MGVGRRMGWFGALAISFVASALRMVLNTRDLCAMLPYGLFRDGAGAATNPTDGAFCFFGRHEDGKDIGLAIFLTHDTKANQTQIYYVRVDVSVTPTPAPTK